MKVLNLYAGIGGNRKLWNDVEVTAVELNPDIAAIYQDFFPDDKVIVADAHQYLLDHYKEFDFIWSSPPCPSHSDIRRMSVHAGFREPIYPDMGLYQEIILLKHYAPLEQKWAIENVRPYYKPLIGPNCEINRHFFWHNFTMKSCNIPDNRKPHNDIKYNDTIYGFNIANTRLTDKRKILRNMVNPEVANYILNCARNTHPEIQEGLFDQTDLR